MNYNERLTAFKDNCGFGLMADLNNIPTHKNLEDAIIALERMMHRGAVAADGKTGDGSGLLLSMPDSFMRKIALSNNIDLPENYAVAMVFASHDEQIETFKHICELNDLKVVFTRDVPVDVNALGEYALNNLPKIVQVFVIPNTIIAQNRFVIFLIQSNTTKYKMNIHLK